MNINPAVIYSSIFRGMIYLLTVGFALCGVWPGGENSAKAAPTSDLQRLLGTDKQRAPAVDVHGQVLSADALQDRLAVVSFVSADCTILCVTRTMDLDHLARSLPQPLRDRVAFLAIDTDPGTDDAPRLRAFADGLFGTGTQIWFLLLDAEGTKAVAEDLRYPATLLPEPPPTILLFDRRGRIAMSYGGAPLDVPRLTRDLTVLNTFTQGVGHPPADIEPTR